MWKIVYPTNEVFLRSFLYGEGKFAGVERAVEPTSGVAYYRKLTSLKASRVLFFGLAELTFVRNQCYAHLNYLIKRTMQKSIA
jgi:hypothetical protein